MQRVWILNWENITYDKDLSQYFLSLANSWIISWLEVQNNKVLAWKAIIKVTRSNWEEIAVVFELTEDLVIDTSGDKKVYIEINQANIDDGTNNSEDWAWIWEIKTWTSYPSTNYLALASIIWWIITDERTFIQIKDSILNWANANELNFNNLTKDINTTWTITANKLKWDWSEITWIVAEATATQIEVTAGEDLSAWDTVRLWRWLVTERIYTDNWWTTWTISSSTEYYQTFTPNEWWVLRNWEMLLKTYSSWSTDVYLELYDSLGNLIWTSNTITLTSVQYYTYTFPWTINLNKGETYKIQFRIVSWDSLYYYHIDDSYSWWIFSYDSTKDLLMDFYIDLTENVWDVFKTDASDINKINFVWFVNETVTSWNTLKVNTSWVDNNQNFEILNWEIRYIRDWLNWSTSNVWNHWVEIQAIETWTWTNLALSKSITSNNTIINSSVITDWDTNSANYSSGVSWTLQYVEIDLWAEYSLDKIQVWHYYDDWRTYYKTRTQISKDWKIWFDVFNSATEWEYVESSIWKEVIVNSKYSLVWEDFYLLHYLYIFFL